MTATDDAGSKHPVQDLCAKRATLPWVAAALAHRIRNPLAGASATLQLLRSRLEDDAHCESLDVVERELDRVAMAMTHFLDVTGTPCTTHDSCRAEQIAPLAEALPPKLSIAGCHEVLTSVLTTLLAMAGEPKPVVACDDSGTLLTVLIGHSGTPPLRPSSATGEETPEGLAVSACRATLRSLGGDLVSAHADAAWRFTVTLPCGADANRTQVSTTPTL